MNKKQFTRVTFDIWIALILFFLHSGAVAQDHGIPATARTYSPGVIVTSITKGDSTVATSRYDLNEDVRVIVQLKNIPLGTFNSRKRKNNSPDIASAQANIQNEHSVFINELSTLENRIVSKPNTIYKASNTRILYEYTTAFNGLAIAMKRWMADEIKKLPSVQTVYNDHEVRINDSLSNHLIGADSVWKVPGITGKGIKIGIIDTGIDYLHPDLGGGIGGSFKVSGGYDFVNNDNNPMDDNGHGTHVAGIAAANGSSLKGVAPDANLYAYKVLDKDGNGWESIVIAGIDRALDPDQNPSTNDAVNVISMSLSSYMGDPDGPMALAVDSAVAYGTVCTVAAGNYGYAYQTIGSPGCARSAITVGASDNLDMVASFSSRGPSNKIFAIKPDIIAPGVSITSAQAGGGYIEHSGTSMATPHVAGCAALLLQLHPEWTPGMVKAALMGSAKDVGYDVWTQGMGRVDVSRAVSVMSLVVPSSLSFGIVDQNSSISSYSDTLHIHNPGVSAESYTIGVSGLPAGATLTFSNNSIVVPPGEWADVVTTLEVNSTIVPDAVPPTYSHTGQILLTSGEGTRSVPFSFVRAPHLKLQFTGATLLQGVVHSDVEVIKYVQSWDLDNNKETILFIPKGVYDIVGIFRGDTLPKIYYIGLENISVPAQSTVRLDASQATSMLYFNLIDQNYTPVNLKKCYSCYRLIHQPSGIVGLNMSSMGFDQILPVHYNNFSNNYLFNWGLITYRNYPAFYSFYGSVADFSRSHTYTNSPENFTHLKVRYNLPISCQSLYLMDMQGMDNENATSIGAMGGYGYPTEEYLLPPFVHDWYLTPLPVDPTFRTAYTDFFQVYEGGPASYWSELTSRLFFVAPSFIATDNRTITAYPPSFPKYRNLSYRGTTIVFGLGPTHWGGTFCNSSTEIDFKTNTPLGVLYGNFANQNPLRFIPLFPYQFQESSPKELSYSLYYNGQLIEHDNVMNKCSAVTGYSDYHVQIPVSVPGIYTIEIPDTNYIIQGKKGSSLMRATCNLNTIDKNPPGIMSLNVVADSQCTDVVRSYQSGEIRLCPMDEGEIKSAVVHYRSEKDTNWYGMSVNIVDSFYTAPIPNTLPDEFISLRIAITDNSDNVLEYTMEPAFKFGTNHPPEMAAITDTIAREDILFTSQVRANDIDGDTLTYRLDIKPEWLHIDSTRGLISGIPRAKNIGDTILQVRVVDGHGGSATSQYRLHVLRANHAPLSFNLVSPHNNDTLQLYHPPRPSVFTWNSAKDIDPADTVRYSFEMSGLSFDTLITGIVDTTVELNIMQHLSTSSYYSWTVCGTDGTAWTISSDSFLLRTSPTITEIADGTKMIPTDYSLSHNYPNPFNQCTIIQYSIPRTSIVTIAVYDMLGRRVKELVNEQKTPGYYDVQFDAGTLSTGIYFYQINAGGYTMQRKMVYLK